MKNFGRPLTIVESIGGTPLLELKHLSKLHGARLLGKAEFFNPLGSVKDRIARAMLEDAEKKGHLKPGMRVVEPTSGNTGIALAFVCRAKGYELTLTMPESASLERRVLLMMLGAEVVVTPAALGMRGAIAKALELITTKGNSFMPSQFDNPANPKVHEQTSAEEIWEQTEAGNFDAFVAGVGTGGTITGCARVFKKRRPEIKIFAVEPRESAVLSGCAPAPHKIQGIGAGFVPGNYDRSLIDEVIKVSSEEALTAAKNLIKLEGIPAGISTGAAIHAATQVASRADYKGKSIVIILPSYTERYLSTLLAEPERSQAQALQVATVDEKILATVPYGA